MVWWAIYGLLYPSPIVLVLNLLIPRALYMKRLLTLWLSNMLQEFFSNLLTIKRLSEYLLRHYIAKQQKYT